MEGTEEMTVILRGLRGWKRAERTLETYSHAQAQATEAVSLGGERVGEKEEAGWGAQGGSVFRRRRRRGLDEFSRQDSVNKS